jgi:structural maintenance of chromosome 1
MAPDSSLLERELQKWPLNHLHTLITQSFWCLSLSVNASGTSDYKVNKKTVSYLDYSKILEKENILIKAKNFLVFQVRDFDNKISWILTIYFKGDVEAVASQSSKELTHMIEHISG